MTEGSKVGTPAKRRILIVDTNPLVRRGLAALIDGESDLTVGAEAATARAALDAIAAVRPALVLADFSFEDSLGLDLVREIRARQHRLPVLLMSMDDAPVCAKRALHLGANGCVSKHDLDETILTAIRAVLDGRAPLSRARGRDAPVRTRRRLAKLPGCSTGRQPSEYRCVSNCGPAQCTAVLN